MKKWKYWNEIEYGLNKDCWLCYYLPDNTQEPGGTHCSMIMILWGVFLARGGGGGGALRYRGGPHLSYVFRGRRGLFLRPPHVRDFVKEGYFFVPRYEVWGSKSPYNPRNIRGSDAEWLPKWLGFRVCRCHLLPLNRQRIIKSKVNKYVFPFIQYQRFDKRRGVYLVEKISVLLK